MSEEEKAIEQIKFCVDTIEKFFEKHNVNNAMRLTVISSVLVRMLICSKMAVEMGRDVFKQIEKIYVDTKKECNQEED